MEPQPPDEEVRWFSFDPEAWLEREQVNCYLTRTTAETHKIIQENLHLSPVYGGWVDAKGPRYCPSIEDKIVRFADKPSHQIFIEPEGRDFPRVVYSRVLHRTPGTVAVADVADVTGDGELRHVTPGLCC